MTAIELIGLHRAEKSKERNRNAYHTDDIRAYAGKIIAACDRWFFVLTIYGDDSAAVKAVAKPCTGHGDSVFCGTDKLRGHLRTLTWREKSMIPNDWVVIHPGFFAALGIR